MTIRPSHNQAYWEQRFLQIKANEINGTEAYERALQPELNGLYRELQSEAEKWLVKYANNQGMEKEEARKALANINTKHWELTLEQFEAKAKAGGYQEELDAEYFKSRIARLQDLQAQLQQHTASFAGAQVPKMGEALAKRYDETYMQNNFALQAMSGNFTANFARFSPERLRTVVAKPWAKDGSNFSARIWKNYRDELPSRLINTLAKGTLLGYSPQRIISQFHATYQDVKRSNIHRLVVSEMAHVSEEATAKSYEENGIDQYEYMATLESRTCDTCRHLDGKVFEVKKRIPGENSPVMHALCRCTTVPYMDDLPEVEKRWSRNPITNKSQTIDNVKFDDWFRLVRSDTEQGIMGMRTSAGTTVTGISAHLVDRALEREFNIADMTEALTNPLHIFDAEEKQKGKLSQKYLGENLTVLVNPETGNIVTGYRTSSQRARKWRKQNETE